MKTRPGLRIVRKYDEDHYTDVAPDDGAYAWDTQWNIDDHKSIPRVIRGASRVAGKYVSQT